jgi:hypothetical protein
VVVVSTESQYQVSIGSHTFDPADTRSVRRRRDDRRLDNEPDPNDTRIVQFERQLTGADIDRLREQYGLALTAYIPNLAYVERVDAAIRRQLAREPLVRAVAGYRPEYKLDPLLAERRNEGETDIPIVASLFDGGSIDLVERELTAAGAVDIESHDQRPLGGLAMVTFTAPAENVVDLASRLPDVRWLELAPTIKEDNSSAAAVNQSGANDNPAVWDRGIHGEGQVIGMLEGGTPDIGHCFFGEASPNTPRPAHRKIVDLRNPSVTAHATFVAGCAVGDERGNSGNHQHRGGAWGAKLAASSVTFASVLTELASNRDAGAFIHTNSWHDDRHGGGNPAPYNAIAVQVDRFLRDNEDHILLGSSGNNGEEQGPPGTAKNALCVSAANTNGTTVGDGNPGPTADGRRKPDIVAVGCGINSSTGTGCATGTRSPCATSYATPHAAGAAALVRQYFIEGWWAGGTEDFANGITPTGALIRAVLVNSAVAMSGESPYPSNNQGWGVLRLDRGLMFVGNARNLVPRDIRNQFGLRTGEDFVQNYTVLDGPSGPNQLRVVLAYTDPPAVAGAIRDTLVNNLNLEVTDPNGLKYVGNDFDPATGFSQPNTTSPGDTVHNLEVVLVDAPPAGTWRVRVVAQSVTVDRQGFALAITATNAPTESSSCFVATAVYGDAEHRDVMALRRWRSGMLQGGGVRSASMRALSAVYGCVGPLAAAAARRSPRVRRVLRQRVFPRLVPSLTRARGSG